MKWNIILVVLHFVFVLQILNSIVTGFKDFHIYKLVIVF